jgi:hypothetical protein
MQFYSSKESGGGSCKDHQPRNPSLIKMVTIFKRIWRTKYWLTDLCSLWKECVSSRCPYHWTCHVQLYSSRLPLRSSMFLKSQQHKVISISYGKMSIVMNVISKSNLTACDWMWRREHSSEIIMCTQRESFCNTLKSFWFCNRTHLSLIAKFKEWCQFLATKKFEVPTRKKKETDGVLQVCHLATSWTSWTSWKLKGKTPQTNPTKSAPGAPVWQDQ